MKWYEIIWSAIKQKWWYSLLLICSSIYVWYYRLDIYELSTWNAQNLIFVLWLILLVLPLFSEIELIGIKIKKEVEKAKDEVKSLLQNLQAQVMQLQLNNSIATNINLGNGTLPSEQKLEELLQIVRKMQSSEPNDSKTTNVNQILEDDKTIFLFKSRLGIETTLRELSEKLGYEEKMPIMRMVQMLYKAELISGMTCDLISQVCKIANRGVHGEIVSDEYIKFVKETYPEIQRQLKTAADSLHYVTCPKCKYSGYSTFENVCPHCGNIFYE